MRQRLLIVLTVFAAIAVLGFAVPLALSDAANRTEALVSRGSSDVDRFAAMAEAATTSGDDSALAEAANRFHAMGGDPVLIVDATGGPIADAGVNPRDPAVENALVAARRNETARLPERLTPWSSRSALFSRPLGPDPRAGGAVMIEASTDRARADIARDWTMIGSAAVIAMMGFGLLAVGLSRWVVRPLGGLSRAVADLTALLPARTAVTDRAPRPGSLATEHGGPPEIRALAESFDAMAFAMADSVDAQRRLVADTAHSMRNPLSAMAVRLDSLEAVVPAPAAATLRGAQAEVDRLIGLLNGLLSLATAETPRGFDTPNPRDDTHCDAVSVVADRTDAWRDAYDEADRRLCSPVTASRAQVAAPADALAQILDVALSNSYLHAGADARVTVSIAVEPTSVVVTVSDDGKGVSEQELPCLTRRFYRGCDVDGVGSGLGLPIAVALANRYGGQIMVESVQPHGLSVAIRLPAVALP